MLNDVSFEIRKSVAAPSLSRWNFRNSLHRENIPGIRKLLLAQRDFLIFYSGIAEEIDEVSDVQVVIESLYVRDHVVTFVHQGALVDCDCVEDHGPPHELLARRGDRPLPWDGSLFFLDRTRGT